MESKVKVVIENLEEKTSKWLLIEYESSTSIAGRENVIFTNVKSRELQEFLEGLKVECYKESIVKLNFKGNVIVLDPQAKTVLHPRDFSVECINYIVVGGILGDHPPRGRTKKLLTTRLKSVKSRSLGREQYTINGAVYMALQVFKGLRVEEIPVVKGLEIEVYKSPRYTHTIYLPYAYPIVDGKPLIPEELVKYLKGKIAFDEVEELSR